MMPDELTVAIQEAIARARERCERCWLDRNGRISSFGPDINTKAPPPHTCDGDLAIVERVALAVATYRVDYTYSETLIEIERLLREGSERGKE